MSFSPCGFQKNASHIYLLRADPRGPRQGPGTARKYLVEAAWQGVYRSPTIRAYFERVLHGRHERRKIALVATAHYLLRCMHAMLVSGKPWHEAA